MQTVTGQHMNSTTPKTFASNQGEIMVEKGNPSHITSVSDLANPAVKVVTCAPKVPCGVPIPASENQTTDYPIAEIKGAPNATAGAAFISYVLGSQGQQVLKSFGFMSPQP